MAKKKFFLIIDTETTQDDLVADFGAVVIDKSGKVYQEAGVLVKETYFDRVEHPLFHHGDFLGGARNLPRRYDAYDKMIDNGQRVAASVAGVNKWLAKVLATYDPVVTAYNWAFDKSKLANTGILAGDMFSRQFCLWHAAVAKWGNTRDYRAFALQQHAFGARTKHGHMGIQTKADVMAKFLLGADYPDEPHTALEDARDYEAPILARLVKNTPPSVYMYPPTYNWRDWALRDHYTVK